MGRPSAGYVVGESLPSFSGRLPVTDCCRSRIRATLLPCCAVVRAGRPRVVCQGCERQQQVFLWCAYCGAEQMQAYALYDYAEAVRHVREQAESKAKRFLARQAKRIAGSWR